MSEPSPVRRSPLHEAPALPGSAITEQAFRGHFLLRGHGRDPAFVEAVRAATGLALPVVPNTLARGDELQLAWLGPSEWQLSCEPGHESVLHAALRKALAGLRSALTPVGDGFTELCIAGTDVTEILARDCPLDLDPRVFAPGTCAQTLLGKCNVLIVREAPERFVLCVRRSFAPYALGLLRHAEDLVRRARELDPTTHPLPLPETRA